MPLCIVVGWQDSVCIENALLDYKLPEDTPFRAFLAACHVGFEANQYSRKLNYAMLILRTCRVSCCFLSKLAVLT